MKIAFLTSELAPYAKVGGLADVSHSLPIELSKIGCEVKIFLPRYSSIDLWTYDLHYCYNLSDISIHISGKHHIIHTYKKEFSNKNYEIYFFDSPYHYSRSSVYTNDSDEGERFLALSFAFIEICKKMNWFPDIIHTNDWPTAILSFLIKHPRHEDSPFKNTGTMLTIHNIEYQGNFEPSLIYENNLDGKYFFPGGPLEFHRKVSFLKAGIVFSDIITTVSENYAREILTTEFGAGLEKVLENRKKDLYGILNGADYSEWNPLTDKYIPYHYSHKSLYRKKKNKIQLLKTFKLPEELDVPLIGIISRLVTQKGFDLIQAGAKELAELNCRYVVLGQGEQKFEDLFRSLAYAFPDKFGVKIGFDNVLAHLIEAGSDMFLMPSKYEPCGLNQIYSLKYGSIPIVRKTGGLADTVRDWNYFKSLGMENGTGFVFEEYSHSAMIDAIKRAIDAYHQKEVWKKIQINAMHENFSWAESSRKYYELYKLIHQQKTYHH